VPRNIHDLTDDFAPIPRRAAVPIHVLPNWLYNSRDRSPRSAGRGKARTP